MRWQEALTGEARRDFEAFLDEQRDVAIARLLVADDIQVIREQEYVRALDVLRNALTKDERESEAYANYTERTRGDRAH